MGWGNRWAKGPVLGLLCRSLLGGVRAGCLVGVALEGMLNPCVGTEENSAQGESGYKSDNITRSCSWLPGPWRSMDSRGKMLGSHRSGRCQHSSGLCQLMCSEGLAGPWALALPRWWRRGAGSRAQPTPGSPPAVAVQAALPARAGGQPGLWL